MYSYQGLERRLKEAGITKTELGRRLGISSRTIARIAKGERLSRGTLEKMADALSCNVEDLVREVPANPVLQRLREEKDARLPGGLYHELQVRMTYNSNHIEGSTLTEEQTRLIFETHTIDAGNGIPVDDILETIHHFRAIDFCIDHAEDPLTEEFIKNLHAILKRDTKDASLPWFAVGEYKRRPNMVGGRETTSPNEVPAQMASLLRGYEALPAVALEDIVAFHAKFEMIHPFQDGNGRIGRLIALKECLRYDIVPFIIEDRKKAFYYRGLAEWETERGFLIGTCLDGQDTFRRMLDAFEV
mgnify:CR=1 FL=1